MDKDEIFLIKKLQFLIEILERYGVKVSDFEFFNEDKPYSVVLGFSEHDKVFEDEIRVLKGQIEHYKSAFFRDSEKLSKLNCENNKLKQRIAELESKEDEKPTKYITVIVAKEINGQEYVRLEDFMSVVNDLQAQIGT